MKSLIQKMKLLEKNLSNSNVSSKILKFVADITEGVNSADICKLLNHSKRKSLLNKKSLKENLLFESLSFSSKVNKKERTKLCHELHSIFPDMTLKEIGVILSLTPSTVHYHLEKNNE